MGQQQLLLVILVTIIIGVASVVAIDTMQTSRTESNISAMRQDMLMILNDAHTYYQKPKMMGGGGKSFDNISQKQIMTVEPTNENGTYTISGSGSTVSVKSSSAINDMSLTAEATISSNGMTISWTKD